MGAYSPQGRRAANIALGVFLFSLTVLFLASLVAYVFLRRFADNPPAAHSLHLPALLWASSAVILAASAAMQSSFNAVRHQRMKSFFNGLYLTAGLTLLFVALQTPAIITLLARHKPNPVPNAFLPVAPRLPLYAMVFFLVLLHAAHVLAGLIALGRVIVRARHGVYDHEHHQGVRFVAIYWHFLDAVWLTMFAVFLIMG